MATVRIVVSDSLGRTLIARRPDEDRAFPGHWELPGGGIERADAGSIEAAAVRELYEGLRVLCTDLVVVDEWTRHTPSRAANASERAGREETTHFLTGQINCDVSNSGAYDRWCWTTDPPEGPMTPSCAWWFQRVAARD